MQTVYVMIRGEITPPVKFGLEKLEAAAKKQNISLEYTSFWDDRENVLFAGFTTDRLIEMLLEQNRIICETKPEGILVARIQNERKKMITLTAGTDETGLMYALCEMASRIRAYGITAVTDAKFSMEYPALSVRAAGRFIQSERDDTWYFSESFWDYYTARLAENRINRLQLITGMDSAYMSPPYPFLVVTPGYENVIGIAGQSPEKRREECLKMLRYIGKMCHKRGISFCFGIWQQKPWTANQKSLVENSPEGDSFADYAQKSIAELVLQCPEIDVLSFRVNLEAGVRSSGDKSTTAQDFWYGMIDSIVSTGKKIALDLRAKGLTDSMIDYAVQSGLPITVPTKAWCEHIALPYQMLQMRTEEKRQLDNVNASRRYSYDDLQKRPRAFDLQYRLWNYGSTNLLLWGEPYHVSRFIKSCKKGQATGFEFTAPLSMKGGHAMIPGDDWPVHIHPDMLHYTFEDERYWMWYLTYGRLSYNPDADPEIWQRELKLHFGDSADSVEQAYIASGRILPLITTAHFPEHPSMHYWPELYSGAALFSKNNYEPYFNENSKIPKTYINSLPSDETLFCSIENFVNGELTDQIPEAYSPLSVADWYYALGKTTLAAVGKMTESNEKKEFDPLAENSAISNLPPEIKSSAIDFIILSEMALFHAYKVHAAYHLYKYQKTEQAEELKFSYAAMYQARKHFARLSAIGTKYYARNIEFDAGTSTKRNGNWQDRLEKEVNIDLADLADLLKKNNIKIDDYCDYSYESLQKPAVFPLSFVSDIPETWEAGKDLKIKLSLGFSQAISLGKVPVMHYRRVNLREGDFIRVEMQKEGEAFTAKIPGNYIIAEYNLYVYFTCMDLTGNMHIYPGVYHAEQILPVFLIETKN